MNKKVTLAILTIVLLAGAGYLVQSKKQALAEMTPPAPLPVILESTQLTKRHISLTIPASAEVRALHESNIASRLSGYVLELPYSEGDQVSKGEVLLRLDDTQARAELLRAKAELARIRLQEDVHKSELAAATSALKAEQERVDRLKALYAIEGISLETMQKAEAALAMARARATASAATVESYGSALEGAEAAANAARQNMEYAVIRSPFDGIVSVRHVQPGDLVAPGKPLLTVMTKDEVRLLVDLPPGVKPQSIRVGGNSLPVKPWPAATMRGMTRYEARTSDLMPGSLQKVDVVVYEREGLFLPHQCLMENDAYSGKVLRINDSGKSETLKVALVATGVEGAALHYPQLKGARIACGTNDLLVRAASGAPFRIVGDV